MRKILISSTIVLSFLVLAGCKKGTPLNIDQDSGTATNVVEFANTLDNVSNVAKSHYPAYYADFGTLALNASASINLNVSYSGKDVAPQDITVALALDTAALRIYNTDNTTTLKAPPAELYKFPASVVIKKGTHSATVQLVVTNTPAFDYSASYGIPLKIASTSYGMVSGNFGSAIYTFGVRNKYDGVYSVKGYAYRGNDPITNTDALQGPVGPVQRSFSSGGVTTINWTSTVPWANGSGSSLPAGYEPIITVDEATNKVTLRSSGGTISPNPAYNNRYDPATKTFYISFTWGAGPTSRLHTDTLTYVKAR